MRKFKFFLLTVVTLIGTTVALLSCSSDDDDLNFGANVYDVVQINGESYACYGYRCPITYTFDWDLSSHRGTLTLPCGKLSDAQKGEYDFDFMYQISLNGNQNLSKGSKLEDFSPTFNAFGDWTDYDYVSGSATIIDKKDDEYVTVKFDSFKFSKGSMSYILNGKVQLDLDED